MMRALINTLARILVLVVLCGGWEARAHDVWIGGKEVDPKTRDLCCSEADTKIADDIVRSEAGGVSFSDRPGEVVAFNRIQPSPDGHWWRSVWGGQIRCVFGPFSY